MFTVISVWNLQIPLRGCVNFLSKGSIFLRLNSRRHLCIVILFKDPNDLSGFEIEILGLWIGVMEKPLGIFNLFIDKIKVDLF